MKTKYGGKCVVCGRSIKQGQIADYDLGGLRHKTCGGVRHAGPKTKALVERLKCPVCGERLQPEGYCLDCGWTS